jgi:type II secretory pathway pseudopilin PulG
MRVRAPYQLGFTYVGLLVAVVVLGLMLTLASRVWSVSEQRERETQLLFVGGEIRSAVGRYVAAHRKFPQSLEDLLGDNASAAPRRFLRRLYYDPMTNSTDWELIPAAGGGIMGVASKSKLTPIKRTGFSAEDAFFEANDCYCTWQFVYQLRYNRGVPVIAPGPNPAPNPGDSGPGNFYGTGK